MKGNAALKDLKGWLAKKAARPEPSYEDVPTEPTGYQQTASRLHSFNRYEIKYLLDEFKVPELRAKLTQRMGSDPFSPQGGYPVTSLYYDTADLRFYWERSRAYGFGASFASVSMGRHRSAPTRHPFKSRSNSG